MWKRTTIHLSDETYNIIKNYNINLSKFVSEQLEEHYQDLEVIEKKIELVQEELKNLKQQKEFFETNKKEIVLDNIMTKTLQEMNEKLADGFDVNAMFKRFKTDFRLFELKRSEFLSLLKKANEKP